MKILIKYLVPFTMLLFVMGCEEDDDLTAPPDGDSGQVVMHLADAPADDVDEVNIVVGEVEVHSDEHGWVVIREETQTFDILQLKNGETVVLSDTSLLAGHYTQIRLHVEEGSYVVVDGEQHELEIPSGYQTGIKLVGEFDVHANESISVLLDFDAHQSIVHNDGGYILSPTIRFQVLDVSGDITGTIEQVDARAVIVASQDGEVITTTYADELDGSFTLFALQAGIYHVTVISREDESEFAEFPEVEVTANQTTDLGTISLENDD